MSSGRFSRPMKTRTSPARATALDEPAEVGPVLERREDPPKLVALGELRRLHHVEQPVAEDLLDRRGVELAERPDDPLADLPGERGGRVGLVVPCQPGCDPRPRSGRRCARSTGRPRAVSVVLVGGRVERDEDLLEGALAQDEDEARESVVDHDEIDPADAGRRGSWPASRCRRRGSSRRGSSPRGGTSARWRTRPGRTGGGS